MNEIKSTNENQVEQLTSLLNCLDALVYVADMDSYEILFINNYGKKIWGDIIGKICWQSLQSGQNGPCDFCTNRYLLNKDGSPGDVYTWDFQNTVTNKWYHIHDRAIKWTDGRIVRVEIAFDITDRKQSEEALQKALEEIKTLQGIIPICMYCKNIRSEKGIWDRLEVYFEKHSDADFSHGICPECLSEKFPHLAKKRRSK